MFGRNTPEAHLTGDLAGGRSAPEGHLAVIGATQKGGT